MDSNDIKVDGKTSQKFNFGFFLELLKSPTRLLKVATNVVVAGACVTVIISTPLLLGVLGVSGVGVAAISAVAYPTFAMALVPCVKAAYDAAQGNYVKNSSFSVSKKFKKVKTIDGLEKEADIINQNLFDYESFLNSKKIPNNFIDKVHYFKQQLFNSFSQLKSEDKNGNKILYGFNSHDGTISTLKKLEELGFIENLYIDKESVREVNFKQLEFSLGFLSFKDFLNPKIVRNKKICDASFNLTGKKITEEELHLFIPNVRLNKCYKVVHDSNGNVIVKVDNKKTKNLRKKEHELKRNKITGKIINLDIVKALPNKFKLVREGIIRNFHPVVEKSESKRNISSEIRQLKMFRENLLAFSEVNQIENQEKTR